MRIFQLVPLMAALSILQGQTPPSLPVPPMEPTALPATPMPPPERPVVTQGSAQIINYASRKSTVTMEMHGTTLAPQATCVAKVRCRDGASQITAKLHDLPPANSLGGDSLTYVLWGITPEGRANNLGELAAKNGKCKIEVTQNLQAFGLVVTAEPYYAVSQPSDKVILETASWKDPKDQPEFTVARYDQHPWAAVAADPDHPAGIDGNAPMEIQQASNAVKLARAAGAPTLAGETFGKAEALLSQAQAASGKEKDRLIAAREAIQAAESARMSTRQRQEELRMAMEKKAADEKLEVARMAAARAAEAASQAQLQASQAQLQASQAQQENETLHGKLKDQLNAVLQTRESARGLIVSMSGVLFKTGKAELAPAAREKLAKIAGILAAHKGLKIEADGYTDSTGSEAFNGQLSAKRAMVTKDFLVSQGVSPEVIIFKGFGEQNPVAPNDTEEGRKENRRVELVVTGAGINEEPKAN